jgi:hypothetical protein
MTVGATTWYAWCKESGTATESGFFFGPAVSVKLNDEFNLTFVYLYGKFNASWDDLPEEKFKTTRHDSDLALNYKLNEYLKLFGGLKYMRYALPTQSYREPADKPGFDDTEGRLEMSSSAIGPGFGLNAAYPIPMFENLFFLNTLSGFYLFETYKFKNESWDNPIAAPPIPNQTIEKKEKPKVYGINATMAIVYYIPSASTVISLGGRYQHFLNQDDSSSKFKFYGITLTATYNFSI